MGGLEAWLTSHSPIPDDEYEVYVIGQKGFQGTDSPFFKFLQSTKYLLKQARNSAVTIEENDDCKLMFHAIETNIFILISHYFQLVT